MDKTREYKLNPINSNKLYGYNEYFITLSKLYKNKRFPKVLLLTGEKGLGKFTMVFHLLNFFFTENDVNNYDIKNFVINTKSDFYKKILLNINENYNYIGKSENKKVSIEQVRKTKKKFFTSSLNNLPRFTILDDADLLNLNSANALLKLIEEPSDQNYFILINNKRKKIIDTIRSRSLEVKVFFKKENKKNIIDNLAKQFNINIEQYSNFISKTTPGTLIKVCQCLEECNLDNKKTFYESAAILLDKYKANKNEIYLESIKFLLDFQTHKGIKNKDYNFIEKTSLNRNVSNILFEYENFNLSKISVLESFKNLS